MFVGGFIVNDLPVMVSALPNQFAMTIVTMDHRPETYTVNIAPEFEMSDYRDMAITAAAWALTQVSFLQHTPLLREFFGYIHWGVLRVEDLDDVLGLVHANFHIPTQGLDHVAVH